MQDDLSQGTDRCCESESCRYIATCAALPSGQTPDAELEKRFVNSGPRRTSTIGATFAALPSGQTPDAELEKRFVASEPRSTSTIGATCAALPSGQPPDAELAKRFVASWPCSTNGRQDAGDDHHHLRGKGEQILKLREAPAQKCTQPVTAVSLPPLPARQRRNPRTASAEEQDITFRSTYRHVSQAAVARRASDRGIQFCCLGQLVEVVVTVTSDDDIRLRLNSDRD
ncbi:uncharacterized protein LOC144120421 [Amblyomma americanum]